MTQETPLETRHCIACTPETPVLPRDEVERLLTQVPEWRLADDGASIWRELRFAGFTDAIDFVNQIAAIAEEEQHHPDILIHGYRYVRIELSTHAIGGLSENDFIMAAKIDAVTK